MTSLDAQVGRHIRHHLSELETAIVQRLREENRHRQHLNHHDLSEYAAEEVYELVAHLAQSLTVAEPALLHAYVDEVCLGFWGRGRDLLPVHMALRATKDVLRALVSQAYWEITAQYLQSAMGCLEQAPADPAGFTCAGAMAQQYLEAVLDRSRGHARDVITRAVEGGMPHAAVYVEVLQPVQRQIGRLWRAGRISVAQEHYCTGITLSNMAWLMDYSVACPPKLRRFLGASVAGELHDLGVRMVCDLIELDGWEVAFLGANTPHDAVVGELLASGVDVVGISATQLSQIDRAAELIRTIRLEPRCERVRIMVGGRPFEFAPNLWQRVGADGTAPDARQAVIEANRLVEK